MSTFKFLYEALQFVGADWKIDFVRDCLVGPKGETITRRELDKYFSPAFAQHQQMQAQLQMQQAYHNQLQQAAQNTMGGITGTPQVNPGLYGGFGFSNPQPGGLTQVPSQLYGHSLSTLTSPAPHQPWTKKSEAIVAGEILAWRIWNVSIEGQQAFLVSVAAQYKWLPNNVAEGDVLKGFGIHAYKDAYGPVHDRYADNGSGWVVGQVALWGDVIEHEKGWRGEYAKIHSLDHWHNVDDALRLKIEKAYLTE